MGTTLPAEDLRNNARRSGLTAWAKRDLNAATEYSLREDAQLNHLRTIANQASSNGPEHGAAWLTSLPPEKIRPLLGHFVSQPPQQDRLLPFQNALEHLPTREGKQEVLSLINEWTTPEKEE